MKKEHIGWYCRDCVTHVCLTIYSGDKAGDYLPIRPTICRISHRKAKWKKYRGEGFERV